MRQWRRLDFDKKHSVFLAYVAAVMSTGVLFLGIAQWQEMVEKAEAAEKEEANEKNRKEAQNARAFFGSSSVPHQNGSSDGEDTTED